MKFNSLTTISIATVLALGLYACDSKNVVDTPAKRDMIVVKKGDEIVKEDYQIPRLADVVNHPDADLIIYGSRLLNETKRLLPDNVGANMNCNSCHIGSGKEPLGAHYFNSFYKYPKIMPRAGKEVDIKARINGCFQRSMNGKPIDPESKEMKAIIAYYKWLAESIPEKAVIQVDIGGKINNKLIPNVENGKKIYAAQCATCHGSDGAGLNDDRGNLVFPPLWGEGSFNIGAGMARTYKAAAFIRDNMPMSVQKTGMWGQGHVLNDQEAVDVAEYFTHMPRPDFEKKVNDWPNGKKPKDARY
ncbi:c-type cytochrome [Taylorella equigenitalis]|uniref:Cytochrome c family protein n=1 Tax=Taylorella equigenitalis (strain MCE9) TaxID=937774 RepID=A0A654KG50_TAYEM|nr:c-type cytochrome [Taylorella equigenitalis]ADU91407.1 Cytochrome c family protein [Taylorella equigenitalis MCE9]WDU56216.1 c-type cytochrome [Taylorella equigenitalis]